ncbi:hypothetical protein X808_17910 [Mannheimia varigena USDA-ARS-USMARC-1296]|uniref:Uncharacterized protein n=1 Tax=Mannheimia varigena USDA-ARS-USMARC-1296 TaxID=1433287 RepID=W0QCR0_9PAST|nr:hypothetical protein [Mannheimia varigena]AHG76311.1 hypothetical protein X808_17910 [Mannheimia varigena USDA-ARS-USMARC-1296]
MIDIKSELLSIEQQRKQKYISLIELLSFLKKHNPNSDFQEIATYLLIKLTPNDVRKTNEELWGDEDFENWCDINGISTYRISNRIDEVPRLIRQTYFFEALESVRDNFLENHWFNDGEDVTDYIKKSDRDIFVDRKRIDELLGVSTLNIQNLAQEKVKQQSINVGMALTKTEEFIKNTDINKSPVGTAERLAFENNIADLSLQLQQANIKIIELEKQLSLSSKMTEVNEDNYNPKERETHLKLIYALTMARTNKDFSARTYFNNKGILKPYTIMNDLIRDFEESGIQGFSADSLRKKLAEILKMEELQAMMGKNH